MPGMGLLFDGQVDSGKTEGRFIGVVDPTISPKVKRKLWLCLKAAEVIDIALLPKPGRFVMFVIGVSCVMTRKPTWSIMLLAAVATCARAQTCFAGDEPAPLKARALAAQSAYESNAAAYFAGRLTALHVYIWSQRWMAAEMAIGAGRAKQRAAARAHFDRIRTWTVLSSGE
jgi:hypothetical protein